MKSKDLRRIEPGLFFPKWKISDIKRLAKNALDEKRVFIYSIKNIKAKDRTFENAIYAMEKSDYKVGDILNQIEFLLYVSPDRSVRSVAEKSLKKLNTDWLNLQYDGGLYKAIKEYESKKVRLIGPDKKLFMETLRSYKRMGFGLPKNERNKLKSNLKKIHNLSTLFSKNINEYKDFILVDKHEAEGLPKSFLGNRPFKNGKYRISLSYPDYFPFMTYSKNEEKRRELQNKFFKKGGAKNILVLKKLLKLRYENAKILGYKNPAEYVIEIKMAKHSKNAWKFLNKLKPTLKKLSRKDVEKLTIEKQKYTKNKKGSLLIHDVAFYARILEERSFNLNKEKIKEYLPLKSVKNGVFAIYSKLFSIKIKKVKLEKWHKDTESYAIFDKSGKKLAYFYLDLFPRDGKYGHAAAFNIIQGREVDDGYQMPVSALVCNFSKSTKNRPSLLSLVETSTFFHEFGHIIHQTLTQAKYSSQSGTQVARDFVEAPSQMLENWVYEPRVLKKITSHYKNRKKMPLLMIRNIIKSKHFQEGYSTARQLYLAMSDLTIHTKYPKKSIPKIFDQISYEMTSIKMPEGNIYPAGFGHLVGYEAGYYGYLWSKVYASDMFTMFKKGGIFNQKIGMDYRKKILEKGGSIPEIDIVKSFLGRKPNEKAFLKDLGIK